MIHGNYIQKSPTQLEKLHFEETTTWFKLTVDRFICIDSESRDHVAET